MENTSVPPAPLCPSYKSDYRTAAHIFRHAVHVWCMEHLSYSLIKRGPGAQGEVQKQKHIIWNWKYRYSIEAGRQLSHYLL